MSNVGTTRNATQLFTDSLLENTAPSILRYFAQVIGDASPSACEIFLNGEKNSRFSLPTNSYAFGTFIGAAWNETDGDAPAGCIVYFGIENDGGTIAFAPTNLSGANGNPINAQVGEAGTWALAADDVNKALVVRFTPTANDVYRVSGVLHYAFAGAGLRNSNFYTVTG